MAKPSPADVEALYATAEAGGLTRAEADAAAAPALGAGLAGPITSLTGALSGAALRRAAARIDDEVRARRPKPARRAGLALEGDARMALNRRHKAGLPPVEGWEHLYAKSGAPSFEKIRAARLTEDQARQIVAAVKAGA